MISAHCPCSQSSLLFIVSISFIFRFEDFLLLTTIYYSQECFSHRCRPCKFVGTSVSLVFVSSIFPFSATLTAINATDRTEIIITHLCLIEAIWCLELSKISFSNRIVIAFQFYLEFAFSGFSLWMLSVKVRPNRTRKRWTAPNVTNSNTNIWWIRNRISNRYHVSYKQMFSLSVTQRDRFIATSAIHGRTHDARTHSITPRCRAINRRWWRATDAALKWCGIRSPVSLSRGDSHSFPFFAFYQNRLSTISGQLFWSQFPFHSFLQRTKWCGVCVHHSYR